MASPSIRVAIVGLGFGAEFIPIYQRHPHAEMAAICQRTKARLDEVGDAFAYSDGRVETVFRVGSDRVWWRTRADASQTAHRNFILPRIAWQTAAGSGPPGRQGVVAAGQAGRPGK